MDPILEQAAKWGVEAAHYDGLGRHTQVDPSVLARILEAIGAHGKAPRLPETTTEQATPAFRKPRRSKRRPPCRAAARCRNAPGGSRFSSMALVRTGIGDTAISPIWPT